MVKNIPTIERSTKIRFGKHVSDSQAENTIVFNASDTAIDASSQTGTMYMSPLRVAELAGSTFIGYDASTKEVVNTGVATSLLGGVTFQAATDNGNTTNNFVGFQNTAPTHAISVADKVFIHNASSVDRITVVGNVRANKYSTTDNSVVIDKDASTNLIQVSGRIHSSDLTTTKIGLANTVPAHSISIGGQGEIQMHTPSETVYALKTTGNVNAQNFVGDEIYGKIEGANTIAASTITASTSLVGPMVGTISGSNTISGSTITASTAFSGSGASLTNLPAGQLTGTISSSALPTVPVTKGGTGLDTVTAGDILYANDSNSIAKLAKGSDGEYLRLDSGLPDWHENIAAKIAATDSTSSSQLPVPFMSAATGDVTLNSDSGALQYQASTGTLSSTVFSGSGASLTSLPAGQLSGTISSSALPTVPVTKGGTGLDTVTAGDILYASASDTIAGLDKGTANKVLQMNDGATAPEWTSTITSATLASPTLSGTIATPLGNNKIVFTDGSGQLDTNSKLQFDDVDTMTIASNLTISGNLLVQGNTNYQHTKTHSITDPLIELGNNNSSDSIHLGTVLTRPTANVFSGYLGDQSKYFIGYTLSDPIGPTIALTNATASKHMELSVNDGNVHAGNVVSTHLYGSGTNITALDAEKITTGVLDVDHGGTNIASYTAGDILYASGATTLAKLAKGSDGEYLRLASGVPDWHENIAAKVSVADSTSSDQLMIPFLSAATGDVTLNSDDAVLKYQASTGTLSSTIFSGSGASLTALPAGQISGTISSSALPTVPVDKGGTNIASYTTGDIVYASGATTISKLASSGNGLKVLGMNSGATAPEWVAVTGTGSVVKATAPSIVGTLAITGTGVTSLTTTNNIYVGGTTAANVTGNVTAANVIAMSNVTSQNLKLTNTQITASYSTSGSGTLTIDAKDKTYGTAPLVSLSGDISTLSISNLPSGGQVVVPLLAASADRTVLKTITTGIDYIAFTDDVTISSGSHGLMTVSKIGASGAEKIYMNAIAFTAA